MRQLVGLVIAAACGSSSPSSTTTATTTVVVQAGADPRPTFPAPDSASPEGRMLAHINEYRAAAGVPPVGLDPALSKGCREHAEYMKINRGKPQLYSINAHTQDPSLPGATPEGADCGKHADLMPSIESLDAAVHGWMGSMYHRRPVISPDVYSVGLGYAEILPGSPRLTVALRFVYAKHPPGGVVIFPGNGQTNVPIDFIREEPNPIPIPVVYAGYPITLQFPLDGSQADATATFVDASGAEVPHWLFTPSNPASQYATQEGLIGVIPKEPLKPATRYTATIVLTRDAKVETFTTTFTTMARKTVDATDEAALAAAIGTPIRLRGTIDSISKITDGLLQLHLAVPRGETVATVEIELPTPILTAQTKLPLHQLKGLKVEAEGTPTKFLGDVQLKLPPNADFRVTK